MNWEHVQSIISTSALALPSLVLQTLTTPWDKISCVETVQAEKKLKHLSGIFCSWYWIFIRREDKQYQYFININFLLSESNLESSRHWVKSAPICLLFYDYKRGQSNSSESSMQNCIILSSTIKTHKNTLWCSHNFSDFTNFYALKKQF